MFYACGARDTCVSSYLIDSLITFAESAGGCPAATHFLLLRQKKVSKEKATLFVVPALRYGHAVVLEKSGVTCKLALLRQARALIRFFLCSSPPLQGWGKKFGFGGSPLPEGEGGSPSPNSIPHPVLAGLRSAGVSGNKFLDVRRRQSRLVSKNSADFEHRKAPEAKRRDPDCGSPFLCLLSFGEAKESELQPGNPRHARKGNRSNQSAVAARGQ